MPKEVGLGSLLKEQLELKNTEQKLTEMMTKVNKHINQLKVEHLQLNSRDVHIQDIKTEPIVKTEELTIEKINKQEIDISIKNALKVLEESEEDED